MVTKPPWATRRTLKLSQFWDFVNELIQANWLMLAKLRTLLSQQDQIVAAEMHSRWMKRCHLSNWLPAPFPNALLIFLPRVSSHILCQAWCHSGEPLHTSSLTDMRPRPSMWALFLSTPGVCATWLCPTGQMGRRKDAVVTEASVTPNRPVMPLARLAI